ncbi:arsenate reductase ArsC [Desulfocurvibacter africanus]|uniref:arsenate reductase ArsC n=1 Tax=Desulfocurvibacter africanus TaxID=873 RepID=UPI002FD8E9F7
MKRVLFICVHNSARSQMAEEYLRKFGGNEYTVESAGFEPTEINPLVVEAMLEEGSDLSAKQTQSVFQLFKQGRVFHYVVTVCDESEEGNCPIFPGMTHRLHLPFPDPAKLTGTHAEKLAKVLEIRDSIKERMKEFVAWERSGAEKPLGDFWERVSVPTISAGKP